MLSASLTKLFQPVSLFAVSLLYGACAFEPLDDVSLQQSTQFENDHNLSPEIDVVFTPPLEVIEVSGFDAGGSASSSVDFRGAVPLLSAFSLEYVSPDHHIRRIRVMPGSSSINFSFYDKNLDDDYRYYAKYVTVPQEYILHEGYLSGTCHNHHYCTVSFAPLLPGQVVALQGFSVKFNSGDRHIDRVAVYEQHNLWHIKFSDDSGDDTFEFQIKYALLSQNLVDVLHTVAGYSSAQSDSAPAAPDLRVLRGFSFDFLDGDEHLEEIAVDVPGSSPDDLYVSFHDKFRYNGVDAFFWNVSYLTFN